MKKNLKKLVALGLVATTGTTLLAGCGGSDKGGSKDGKVELVMSVWDSLSYQKFPKQQIVNMP